MASGSLARRHSPRTAPQRGALLFLPALQFALLWPSVAGQLLDEAAAAAAATAAAGATEGVDQASAAGVTHEFGVAMADGAGSEYEAAGVALPGTNKYIKQHAPTQGGPWVNCYLLYRSPNMCSEG